MINPLLPQLSHAVSTVILFATTSAATASAATTN
jgi:hypothetical protein